MPSIYFTLSAAVLAGFASVAQAQTNITTNACADGSNYSSCNRNVANNWSSCVNDCNGNGNCIVDCGCTAHQEYINCMAQSCWNQVRSASIDQNIHILIKPTGLLLRVPTLRATVLRRVPQRR